MSTLLRGLVAGFLLSALRAPLGIDLVQTPATEARSAYFFRALAILLVAVGVAFSAQSLSFGFLFTVALGFSLHALLLAGSWIPSSAGELWFTGGLWCVAMILIGKKARAVVDAASSVAPPAPIATVATADTSVEAPIGEQTRSPSPVATRPRAGAHIGASTGLFLAGAGAAIAIESVARHVRLFGAGLAQDDSVSAIVLLFAIAAGAASFGWIGAARRLSGLSLAAGLAAAACAAFLSLRVVHSIADPQGFDRYLHVYGLDASQHGLLACDALIAAACFIAPASITGAALRGASGGAQTFCVLAGAAAGLVAVPRLLASDPGIAASTQTLFSAQLVPIGALIAVAGGALAILCASGASRFARGSMLAFTLLLALVPATITVYGEPVSSPWESRPPGETRTFMLVLDAPEGLITVEPSRGGLKIATLDRRSLTPTSDEIGVEAQRLEMSIEMLPANVRARGALRVLLIGQLNPLRWSLLTQAGAATIDRSAAWCSSMARMEAKLFEDLPMPAGEILAPREAAQRIAAGTYDLVLVPPVPGDAPVSASFDAPASTTLVGWLGLDQPAQQRELGPVLLLASDGLDFPSLARIHNARTFDDLDDSGARPQTLRSGVPVSAPTPLTWLSMRESERDRTRSERSRAAMFTRLEIAARGTSDEDLVAGLAAVYRAQEASSPFETRAQRIELPDAALARFTKAALAAPPNLFVRQLVEGVARLLVEKRWIEKVYAHVQPIAEKYASWPALEKMLARADLESLEPREAVRRFSALESTGSQDFEMWWYMGQARAMLGEHAACAADLKRARDLRPDHRGVRRLMAMELVRGGDPSGRALVEELLREDPKDESLKPFLGEGPYPADFTAEGQGLPRD